MFPCTVDGFNLVLKLAHFGGEHITIPVGSPHTFRFYMDNFIQNSSGTFNGNSSWRILPNSEDRTNQWTGKYTSNTILPVLVEPYI